MKERNTGTETDATDIETETETETGTDGTDIVIDERTVEGRIQSEGATVRGVTEVIEATGSVLLELMMNLSLQGYLEVCIYLTFGGRGGGD